VVQDLRFRSTDCVDSKFDEAFAGIGSEVKEAQGTIMKKAKPYKIKIEKHAKKFLDGLSIDERQGLMKEFIEAVQDGSFIEKSKPVDMAKLKAEEPEVYRQLMEALQEEAE
jgi:hypothetical protein